MNTPRDSEHELEAFLHDDNLPLRELYRRLPQTQPDNALDQRVLQLARQALASDAAKPMLKSRPKPARRWPIALGSAASVLFAAVLALHFGVQNWQAQQHAPPAGAADVIPVHGVDAAVPTLAPVPVPAPPPVAQGVAPSSAMKPAAAMAKALPRSGPPANRVTVPPVSAMSSVVAPPPPVTPAQDAPSPAQDAPSPAAAAPGSTATSEATRQNLETIEVTGSRVHRVEVEVASPAPTIDERQQNRDERDAVERKLDLATGREAALRARSTDSAKSSGASGVLAQSAPTTAAPMQPMAPARAPARIAAPASAGAAQVAAAASAPAPARQPPPTDPVVWLQRIRDRIAAGQHEPAQQDLREFHRTFPDYPLPADLSALLP